MDDGVFSNQISGNECRTCGRIGCEGGPQCTAYAESRGDYHLPVMNTCMKCPDWDGSGECNLPECTLNKED